MVRRPSVVPCPWTLGRLRVGAAEHQAAGFRRKEVWMRCQEANCECAPHEVVSANANHNM